MSMPCGPNFPPWRGSRMAGRSAFLDGPGGTQVPQRVIDAVTGYYTDERTPTRRRVHDERAERREADEAHAAVADFLGAASPDEIKFGYNMTTLTLHSAAPSARRSSRATRSSSPPSTTRPTSHLGGDGGGPRPDGPDGRHPRGRRDPRPRGPRIEARARTKLVAVGYATNAVGTINPVTEIVDRAHEVGALTCVDAVAFAPHGPSTSGDSTPTSWSAARTSGSGRTRARCTEARSSIAAGFKVRPAHDRFETGTPAFESIAGTLAATDYLRDVGRRFGDVPARPGPGGQRTSREFAPG